MDIKIINDQSIPLFSNPFVLTIFGKRSYHLMIVDHDIVYTGKHPWGKLHGHLR